MGANMYRKNLPTCRLWGCLFLNREWMLQDLLHKLDQLLNLVVPLTLLLLHLLLLRIQEAPFLCSKVNLMIRKRKMTELCAVQA